MACSAQEDACNTCRAAQDTAMEEEGLVSRVEEDIEGVTEGEAGLAEEEPPNAIQLLT